MYLCAASEKHLEPWATVLIMLADIVHVPKVSHLSIMLLKIGHALGIQPDCVCYSCVCVCVCGGVVGNTSLESSELYNMWTACRP